VGFKRFCAKSEAFVFPGRLAVIFCAQARGFQVFLPKKVKHLCVFLCAGMASWLLGGDILCAGAWVLSIFDKKK